MLFYLIKTALFAKLKSPALSEMRKKKTKITSMFDAFTFCFFNALKPRGRVKSKPQVLKFLTRKRFYSRYFRYCHFRKYETTQMEHFHLFHISCFISIQNQLGSITNRCSGKEPALLPRRGTQTRHDTRERRRSSLKISLFLPLIFAYFVQQSPIILKQSELKQSFHL